MDSKQVEVVSKKMKPNQIMIDYVPVTSFGSSGNKNQSSLVITTDSFYLLNNNHIKKQTSIADIRSVTISIYSQEIVLHFQEDDIRISSNQNAKILGNILKVRDRVLKDKSLFTVMLQNDKSLSKYVGDGKKTGFWSSIFGNKDQPDKKSRLSGSSSRKSFSKLQVSEKTYLIEISRAIYAYHYANVKLLYVNGIYNFFFDELDYNKEQVDPESYIFRHKQTKQAFLMHKISKQNEQSNKILRKYLQYYKFNNIKEEILYAVQSDRYFQIITNHFPDQNDLQSILKSQKVVPQLDIVSLFYSLMALIDGQMSIFYSLRPKHIFIRNDNIVINAPLCLNKANSNPSYLAPEQLNSDISPSMDSELINFWKIGIMLYQIAYLIEPFPIEYLAEVVARNKTLKLTFPTSTRSVQMKQFLCQILQIDIDRRGGGKGWKKKVYFFLYRFSNINGSNRVCVDLKSPFSDNFHSFSKIQTKISNSIIKMSLSIKIMTR